MTDCDHNWNIYSTALSPPTIMVECDKCDAEGQVTDFTGDEWDSAFYRPRPWHDNERVTVIQQAEQNDD